MNSKENVLVVLANDFMKIGGLRIPANRYMGFLREKYDVNEVLMGYHVYGYKNHKQWKRKLLSKIDKNTHAVIIFSGINQAYTTIKLINEDISPKLKKVFYIADSPYLYIKSHLELCKNDIDSLRKKIELSIKKIIYKYKETYVLEKFDEIIYISPVDAEFVKETYKMIEANISMISHATDAQQNYVLTKRINSSSFRIGFLTAISEQTYIESIKHLVYKIMPPIVEKFPNTILLIVGKGSSTKRVEEIDKLRYVEYIDYIENLDEFYNNIDIVVAPIRKRNGILNKALEAWGFGKCTVGYDYNFDAFIEATEGTHYLSGRDSKEIAEKILEIIIGNIDISKIEKAAYELAKKNYNWINQKYKFMEIVN